MEALYPFVSLGQALQFYNTRNPVRQRSVNLLEPELRGECDIAGFDSEGLWVAICECIKCVLRSPSLRWEAKYAWQLRNIGERDDFNKRPTKGPLFRESNRKQLSVDEISVHLAMPPKAVYRHLNDVNELLTKELVERELLPPSELQRYA